MELRRGEVHELGNGAGFVEVVDPGPAPGIRIDRVKDLESLDAWLRGLHYNRLVVHRGEHRIEMSGSDSIGSFLDGLKLGREVERQQGA